MCIKGNNQLIKLQVMISRNVKDFIIFLFLILTLCYTFVHSSGGMTDISNHDYLYYMHLCYDSNYTRFPMLSGTFLFYKPLFYLFGYSYWMWQKFHWILNLTTILIPYFTLLNGKQRHRYLYVVILLVLIALYRMGCEPPRLVYFFLSITLVCLVKYSISNRFRWIIIMSMCLSLIAYIRFPSLFVYPLIALAIICLTNKHTHRIAVLLFPLIGFVLLIMLTSGSLRQFLIDLGNSFNETASGQYGIKLLFLYCVQSVVCYMIYVVVFITPFILLSCWKKQKQKIFLYFTCISFLICLVCIFYCPPNGEPLPYIQFFNYSISIVFHHPIPQLLGPLSASIMFIYIHNTNYSKTSIVLGLAIVLSAMVASTGSDFGFIHGYMSVAFLPFFASNTPCVDWAKDRYENKCRKPSLHFLFVCLCFTFIISLLLNDIKSLKRSYYDRGGISVINGGRLANNLDKVFWGKQTFEKMAFMQNEYMLLEKKYSDVIFWGWWSYYMSLANNKWPVTSVWEMSSTDVKGPAFTELQNYVKKHRPAVIDTERHLNMETFLTSIGYIQREEKYYRIYTFE